MPLHSDLGRSSGILVESLEGRRLLSAGQLDPSFGTQGNAVAGFNGLNVQATAVVVQGDGKTVVVGTASAPSSDNVGTDIALARFNYNGTLDTTFGPNHTGTVTLHEGSGPDDDVAYSVALGPKGTILVGGTYRHSDGSGQFMLLRFTSSGSLDPTFAVNGFQTADFGFLSQTCAATAMGVQNDGRIVLAGYEQNDLGSPQFAVMRFYSDGTLDNSFDDDGKKTIDFPEAASADSIAFDYSGTANTNADYGSIYLAGYTGSSTDTKFAVIRLTSTGVLDYSFHGGGRYEFSAPGHNLGQATAITVQPTGRLVVSGFAATYSTQDPNPNDIFAMTRLTTAGIIDPTFAIRGHGWVQTTFGNDDRAQSLIVGEGNRLIVGGNAGNATALAAFTSEGQLDTSFGTGGKVTVPFGLAAVLAYGPGNRFVVTGSGKFDTARYYDTDGGLVYATGLVTSTSEKGPAVNFIVYRSEDLPVPTRVYFTVGGTAMPPSLEADKHHTVDYELSGLTIPVGILGSQPRPYVDIPANQTFTTVTLTPIDRGLTFGQKTATFTVSSDPSYISGTPSGLTVTINDNDGSTPTTLNATADAYVQDGSAAGANYGSAPSLVVKTGAAGLNRLTYIKFDLSSVSTINAVKLQLFGNLSNAADASVVTNVYSVADTSWTENGITYNNAPVAGTSALASATISGTTGKIYTWDVTAYVKAQKAAGYNTVSFVLKDPLASNSAVIFNSREASTQVPSLLIS